MTTFGTISAGLEPIPGYILRRRLGAGGFGEVWLADAPGGLKKAVKIVYGTLDQERAASELRSLQRIRQVMHPFLLSLERIEIVKSQIVIVTELAECSVQDRFQHFRNKDLPGIPRDILLEYLRDAADALDFISQKHELQHLDVKPGNLLLIADRIKVADFGLVKDLQERNQSLVGGLTPSYAAPEIFDGRPNRRSDQYSLAIVFQEMLTGQMPFNGRTTAELARQHLNQAPDLTALPPSDRPILLRALAKNPLDRFSSCRQLIDQLAKVRAASPVVSSDSNRAIGTHSTAALTTSKSVTSATSGLAKEQVVLPKIDVDGNCQTWVAPRCLFIGIGGVGCNALTDLYHRFSNDIDSHRPVGDHGWLAIDTDSDSLDNLSTDTSGLPSGAKIQIPLYKPQEYRNANPQLFRPLSRRWLYNIPRSLKTEGVRPLGMLAFLDHYAQLRRTIAKRIDDLIKSSVEDASASNEPIRVYLLSSAHGGTGSAVSLEMGYLIRDIFRDLGWRNYRLIGNFSAATTLSVNQSEMATSSAIACIAELTHCMQPDALIPPLHYESTQSIHNPERPFDWICLHDGGLYGASGEVRAVTQSMSESIWLDSQTLLGPLMENTRSSGRDRKHGWIRTIQSGRVRSTVGTTTVVLSRTCISTAISRATMNISGCSTGQEAGANNATYAGEMPLTAVATEDILANLLDELKVHCSDRSREEEFLTAWVFRLSDIGPEVESQFSLDRKCVFSWLRGMVGKRVYNWRQIEKLLLILIERLMNEVSNDESELLQFLHQFDFPGTAAEVRERVQAYIKRLALDCLELLQQFQVQEKEISNRLLNWEKSLVAEQSLADCTELPTLDTLPSEWHPIATRTVAVLDSVFQRIFSQALDAMEQQIAPSTDAESMSLSGLLILSRDLCDRFARELRVTLPSDSTKEPQDTDQGLPLSQLADFWPQLSEGGGKVHRLVVVPQDQSQSMFETIRKLGLSETTAVIPSTLSRTSYMIAEASSINLSALCTGLWRPSDSTLQLAERLLTRVDIEWPNVSGLLMSESDSEADQSVEDLVMPISVVAPLDQFVPTEQLGANH